MAPRKLTPGGMTAFGLAMTGSLVAATPVVTRDGGEGPCDIYGDGGTPCVAAHSTTRALYGSYSGPLYQLQRGSDSATKDISPLSAGDVANSADQDDFCNGSTCIISTIYDQSGNGNHLTQAPPGSAAEGPEEGGYDFLAGAYGAPVLVNGKKAYGVFGSPMTGYRNDETKNIATGDDAEGMYAVFDGTHFNNRCCFDYGNAETDNTDPGDGHMEALYFGTGDGWSGTGSGSGPWVMADLENYLFSGENKGTNENPSRTSRFVTGVLKGQPGQWSLGGGDANSGTLTQYYEGPRPTEGDYKPMQKEGAIILGIGGDNSDGSQGTFYEGAMTSGYPSEETEQKVQANIVAAKYEATGLNMGDSLTVGDTISLKVTTPGFDNRYLAHDGSTVNTQELGSNQQQASWTVRTGLGNDGCFSFESVDSPGSFIRHSNYELHLDSNDGSKGFGEDATFCTQDGVSGKGITIRSWSYAARYIRHYAAVGYISANGGPFEWDNAASFNDDISFEVGGGLA